MLDAPRRPSQKVGAMFAAIARRYDLANHLLSGGLDFFWRSRAAVVVSKWAPERVLDLATGTGDLALKLAQTCPGSTIVGVDFCQPMLALAEEKGVANLVAADGLQLPFADRSFDVVTVAFGLRNMRSWRGAVAEMGRVLRPGGHLLILEFSLPGPPLRWIYRPYLHTVLPRLAALLTGVKDAYEYLGDSIEDFPRNEAMCTILREARFEQATCERLSAGIVALYSGRRAG